jgi:hypothetical protein
MSARLAETEVTDSHAKAALGGKRKAYLEAAAMIEAVERGWRIPWGKAKQSRFKEKP